MKVAAVVVTYNRRALLKECLQALLRQTRPLDEVIVIDNAGTDGTNEMVSAEFPQITYVRLPENIGGAGGFHEGMKLAYEKGHDWIWVMDDDTEPMRDALEQLLVYTHEFKVLVSSARVMGQPNQYDERVLGSVIAAEKIFRGQILSIDDFHQETLHISSYPLLGILIERSVLKDVGFPNLAFFIQADDTDFTLRISAKFPILWVRDSALLHFSTPQSLYEQISFLGKTLRLLRPEHLWKDYYGFRNYIYLIRHHLGLWKAISYAFKRLQNDFIKYTIAGPRYWFALILYMVAFIDGLLGRLGKRSKYLPKIR